MGRHRTSAVLLALLASGVGAFSCSTGPPTGVLYVIVHGEGQVAVSREKNPSACVGAACSTPNVDGGALEIPYAAGSEIGLQAEADTGWQFVSWQVAVNDGTPTTSTTPSLTIANGGNEISILATFTLAIDAGIGAGIGAGAAVDASPADASEADARSAGGGG